MSLSSNAASATTSGGSGVIFPKRPWLARRHHNDDQDYGGDDIAVEEADYMNGAQPPPPSGNNHTNSISWKSCAWGDGLAEHWCEENDLPPIGDRPLMFQIDDLDVVDDAYVNYLDGQSSISWPAELTLQNAKGTVDALESLKHDASKQSMRDQQCKSIFAQTPWSKTTMAAAAAAAATSSAAAMPADKNAGSRRWASYAFLFFLLLSVVVYTVILVIGEDVKFLPGYSIFQDYTPIAYATLIFSLGIGCQFIL